MTENINATFFRDGFLCLGMPLLPSPGVRADPRGGTGLPRRVAQQGHRPAHNHLAFGHGLHQRLGQSLARLEFQVVFGSLLVRLPGLKLAVPFDELRFKGEEGGYGLHELPVSW